MVNEYRSMANNSSTHVLNNDSFHILQFTLTKFTFRLKVKIEHTDKKMNCLVLLFISYSVSNYLQGCNLY